MEATKYLLKKDEQDKGVLCVKVTIDGFDYYVSDEKVTYKIYLPPILTALERKVIAMSNPNIDLPKIVDEVEVLYPTNIKGDMWMPNRDEINNQYRQEGYNKSQEAHPNSDKDTIKFAKWLRQEDTEANAEKYANFTDEDMLKLWKSQQPKVIYYQ